MPVPHHFQLVMWDFESPRNKTTVFLHRASSCKKRLKSLSSNPCEILSPNYNYNEQEILQNINPQTLGVHPKIGEFMRQQKKLNVSPAKIKNRQTFNLQLMQYQARSKLKKLSYKEKLFYIQQLLKTTRELCKNYGYFSITFPMLKISCAEQIKIQIWIHPDRRCSRPLHPIKKSTQFDCELSCVFDLKNIIKKLFPTIDLGNNKTFSTLIAHIDSLKLTCDPKLKSKGFIRQNSIKTTQSHNNQKTQDYYLNETNKAINNIKDLGYKQNQTLVETIGSINSLKQKIDVKKMKEVSYYKRPKLKQSFSSPFPQQNVEYQEKIPASPNTIQPSPQKTIVKSQQHQYETPHSKAAINLMKTSLTGQRFMTMSIQIQSQINNLFGNDDMGLNNFYHSSSNKNSNVKNLKNSLLSRVAQEFQDLF